MFNMIAITGTKVLRVSLIFNLSEFHFLFFKTNQKTKVGTRREHLTKVVVLETIVLTGRILHFMKIK
jgi:hypothetical protein